MIEIDGSLGEGGGQIIRSALALSCLTGKPFMIRKIRAKRPKPGLQNQHLTAVKAAAEVSAAQVSGAELGSQQLKFSPGQVKGGRYVFKIGTAGSTTLVLQTVLPPLMLAEQPSELILEGGTHNTHAPPYDFLFKTFIPVINRFGPRVTIELDKYGFYPPGGGRIRVNIGPSQRLERLVLLHRGQYRIDVRSILVKLPRHIAERELKIVEESVSPVNSALIEETGNAISPGNVLIIEVASEQLTETITEIAQRGLPAEKVAQAAVEELQRYLAVDAPVGEHLADQLLMPMALAGAGSYLTVKPTLHTETNIEVIKMFLDVRIKCEEVAPGLHRITVS